MSILGIDQITYGVDDLAICKRFFLDWGLALVEGASDQLVFETLNGCRVIVARMNQPGLPPAFEAGPTLREVVWGVESADDLARFSNTLDQDHSCTDPNGLTIRFQVTQKRALNIASAGFNTWQHKGRIDQASPAYERATPVEVGHVVFFVKDVAECERFYVERFGFVASDHYPGRGAFLRCAADGGHHDLFLLQRPAADAV